MLLGTGLAFYLGKPFIQPQAPRLPAIPFGWWSTLPQVQAALQVNVLFLLGAALAPLLAWGLTHTRWGLILQTVGDSADAARALGYSVTQVRLAATAAGGCLAGIGGSFLGSPPLWRCRRSGTGVAVGWGHLRLLPFQCRSIRAHAAPHDCDKYAPATSERCSWGAQHHQISRWTKFLTLFGWHGSAD